MAKENNSYSIENFLEYWGTRDTVQKKITECDFCGSKLIFTHLPDYKNLIIQETARCTDCGEGGRRKIHVLN